MHLPQITLEQHPTLRSSGIFFSSAYTGLEESILAHVQQDSIFPNI